MKIQKVKKNTASNHTDYKLMNEGIKELNMTLTLTLYSQREETLSIFSVSRFDCRFSLFIYSTLSDVHNTIAYVTSHAVAINILARIE